MASSDGGARLDSALCLRAGLPSGCVNLVLQIVMHVFRRGGAKWTDTVYTILLASEGVFQVSPFVSYHISNKWFQFVRVVRSEVEYDNVVLNRKVRLHVGPLRVSAGRCKCHCLTSRISDDVEFNYLACYSHVKNPTLR